MNSGFGSIEQGSAPFPTCLCLAACADLVACGLVNGCTDEVRVCFGRGCLDEYPRSDH